MTIAEPVDPLNSTADFTSSKLKRLTVRSRSEVCLQLCPSARCRNQHGYAPFASSFPTDLSRPAEFCNIDLYKPIVICTDVKGRTSRKVVRWLARCDSILPRENRFHNIVSFWPLWDRWPVIVSMDVVIHSAPTWQAKGSFLLSHERALIICSCQLMTLAKYTLREFSFNLCGKMASDQLIALRCAFEYLSLFPRTIVEQ